MNSMLSLERQNADASKIVTGSKVAVPVNTFEQLISKERERLNKARVAEEANRAEIDGRIDAIDNELRAIDAYEGAKLGKAPRNKRTRTRRIGRRAEVLAAIKKHPQGITRGELLNAIGATDKSEQQSVSNAIAALKRSGAVNHEDGKYMAT